jgi:phosphoglycolate phosphatase
MAISFFPPRLIVFDLDGCLVDSLPAIAQAANDTRRCLGKRAVSTATVAGCMSGPMTEFVRQVLAVESTPVADAEVPGLARLYASLYQRASSKGLAQPYEGVTDVLRSLADDGRSIAVLTNKAERLARLTLADAGLHRYFDPQAVIGCDTLSKAKPHPMPLRNLMWRFRASCEVTWMVGDSGTDVAVARSALCSAIACRYGYGNATECLPDAVISSPYELLKLARIEAV